MLVLQTIRCDFLKLYMPECVVGILSFTLREAVFYLHLPKELLTSVPSADLIISYCLYCLLVMMEKFCLK